MKIMKWNYEKLVQIITKLLIYYPNDDRNKFNVGLENLCRFISVDPIIKSGYISRSILNFCNFVR